MKGTLTERELECVYDLLAQRAIDYLTEAAKPILKSVLPANEIQYRYTHDDKDWTNKKPLISSRNY